ncbi:hypothetical protein FOL47_010344 [Perkinsus chesapeaki]|uniref:Major facilitator super domain-containing protein 1 n=1 Tax=Perkinsus chesapeaki TaxID=330153 RepID=A0A7J6L408_PERCH|nr:hypothetical protein FOL47_010344 [Perkinsus chesapeaki]
MSERSSTGSSGEGDELDEFCSLRSGSSGGEFLTPRLEVRRAAIMRVSKVARCIFDSVNFSSLGSQEDVEDTGNNVPERKTKDDHGRATTSSQYNEPPPTNKHTRRHPLEDVEGGWFENKDPSEWGWLILEYLRIDHEHFAMLFSLPSLTGVLCGPFGVIVAKYGSTKSALAAAALTCVGSALVAVGLENRNFGVVLVGRIIFWTFLYILCVVQTVLCYRLFSGRALVAAYGLIIVACRTGGLAGSAFNASLLGWFRGDIVKAVSFSCALTGVGLVCAITFAVLYKGTRTARLIWPLLARRDDVNSESSGEEDIRNSLKTLPGLYWVLWLALGLLYATIFPFETVAVDYYVSDWGMSQQKAGKTVTLLLAFTFIIVGLLGQVLHITSSPLGFMIVTGWGYALGGTCAWVLASDILVAFQCNSPSTESIAVAMLYVSLGVMLFISNFLAGITRDHSKDYRSCILFFAMLSTVAWGCAAVLCYSASQGSLAILRLQRRARDDGEDGWLDDDSDDSRGNSFIRGRTIPRG